MNESAADVKALVQQVKALTDENERLKTELAGR